MAEVDGSGAGPGRESVDVAIVGAGFAGLAAARAIARAGCTVAVLEGRDRTGGRTFTTRVRDRLSLDLGGQWIGPRQARVTRLVGELGVETFPTHDEGASLLAEDGRVTRYHGTIPRPGGIGGLFALADLGVAMWRLDRMAAAIDVRSPWLAPGAHRLDALTLGDWSRSNVRLERARRLFDTGLRVVFGAEPETLSLLHVLFYARAAGGLDQLIATRGGAQATRFRYGTADLAQRLAAPVVSALRLSSPVHAVADDGSGVTIRTPGAEVRARRVVVSVPPTLAGRITFEPPLDAMRHRLLSSFTMGSTSKIFAVYERPFWRDAGLSGQSVRTHGPVSATFDASLPGEPEGILLAFAVGSGAEALRRLDASARREAVLGALAALFGAPAASPVEVVERSWADERLSGGCPTASPAPGAWTAGGEALRRPHGRVHWAGTETATEWCGYIEGALESGERAAAEVLATL
jgi:monoamine oxidase